KQNYLAHALGTNEATPLQVASAYTSFAQLGTRVTPVGIARVTTGAGNTIAAPQGQKSEVMRPQVAFIMDSIMKDVVNRGTAAKVRARGFRANVAGKTGTSRDGWFAGFTPNLVCVVYVGFDDGSELGMTGADSALPIWADFMTAALAAHPEWGGDWQEPSDIEHADIDPSTGMLASADSTTKRTELFIHGTAPTQESEPEESATPEELDIPETDPDAIPTPVPLEVPPLPDATPSGRRRGDDGPAPPNERLSGTVTLDIDPTTGLIAAPTCPVVRTKIFTIGTEPHRHCGPQYHQNQTIIPSETRPRRVSP
ncbi:MAG TPA: penicillin-binding transpeptidase domain-containing protein, partial [Pyrinomonadaceae bacterium]|nr:penicillin-binding transpeptidase domain-containing protein [Pyrinomonadaceae bacterium]